MRVLRRSDVLVHLGSFFEWGPAQSCCDTSGFQIGANCNIFPQDSRSGKNLFADTKGANDKESRHLKRRGATFFLKYKMLFWGYNVPRKWCSFLGYKKLFGDTQNFWEIQETLVGIQETFLGKMFFRNTKCFCIRTL